MGQTENHRATGGSSPRPWIARLAMAAVGLIGLVMVYHPMLLTGLGRIQTTADDTRLINYLFEHSYLWFKREPPHRHYWDPPFFYPAPNVAAFSDTLLTVAPIYWGWRALGFLPDTAYQLWMLTIYALNYLAGYWLLRSGFRRGVLGSIAGAFLFAFAAPRANEVEHQQLGFQVYTVVTLMALIRIFTDWSRPRRSSRALVLWSVAGLALVAQFYASFYLGWFLVLALGLAGVWGFCLPRYRRPLIGVIREQWMAIGCAAVLATAAIRPLLDHYLLVASEVGMRNYHAEVAPSIPDWRAWVYMGPASWIWGWMPRLWLFHGMGLEQAMRNGVGLLTSLACLAGLFSQRHVPTVRLVGLTMIGLVLVVTRFQQQIAAGVALGLWTTCVVEIYRRSPPTSDRRILVALALFLGLMIFPGVMVAVPLALTVLLLMPGRLLPGRAWSLARPIILAALIGFPFLISHAHRPLALAVAAGVVAILEIGRSIVGPARTPWPMVIGGTIVCLALWLFPSEVLAWPYVAGVIPGGMALRVVSRGLLLGLIPAALGMACFIESAGRLRIRRGLACALVLACLLEQGSTTSSYDKYAKRAEMAELARKVDPKCRSFFYSPRYSGLVINPYHLDAMWVEIETKIPTINGYSGLGPPGWFPLYYAGVVTQEDVDRVGRALSAWAARNRMNPDEICWIVGSANVPVPGGAGSPTTTTSGSGEVQLAKTPAPGRRYHRKNRRVRRRVRDEQQGRPGAGSRSGLRL